MKEVLKTSAGVSLLRTLDGLDMLDEQLTNEYDDRARLIYSDLVDYSNHSRVSISIEYHENGEQFAITRCEGGPFDGIRVESRMQQRGRSFVSVFDRSGAILAQSGIEDDDDIVPDRIQLGRAGPRPGVRSQTAEAIDDRDGFGNWTKKSIYTGDSSLLPKNVIMVWERAISYFDL